VVDEPLVKGARVLVTGAGGFVGQAVSRALKQAGYKVRGVGRHQVGEIHRGTDWSDALNGCQAVVHLAARVHEMSRDAQQDLEAYREVNLHGTTTLMRQAVSASVTHFVFMSTLKVLGEEGVGLSPASPPAPQDAYSVSKVEAEAALRRLAPTEMACAILRPPLVYGPGVRANFARLMRLVASGYPLPFGAIQNERSLIYVENLADAVRYALSGQGGVFHPKDGPNLSTPDLIRALAVGMDRPARLVPMPVGLLRGLVSLAGLGAEIDRLAGSFTSDGEMGGWHAPIAADQALAATARAFIDEKAT